MAEDTSEVALSGGPSGLTASYKGKRMAEFVAIGSLMLLGVLAYGFHKHEESTDRGYQALAVAIKDMTVAQRLNVEAQREMNCLIALPTEKREREYMAPHSLCKQLSRER